MPLFSVIIPIYNTELFLERCIKSILDQKHSKTEIILIDEYQEMMELSQQKENIYYF